MDFQRSSKPSGSHVGESLAKDLVVVWRAAGECNFCTASCIVCATAFHIQILVPSSYITQCIYYNYKMYIRIYDTCIYICTDIEGMEIYKIVRSCLLNEDVKSTLRAMWDRTIALS